MENEEINEVSEYLGLCILPENVRRQYYLDINVAYCAEEIVYLLQYIAQSINAFVVGLASAYVYSWLNKQKNEKELEKILDSAFSKNKKKLYEIGKDIKNVHDYLSINRKHDDASTRALLKSYEQAYSKMKNKEIFLKDVIKYTLIHSNLSRDEVEEFIFKYDRHRNLNKKIKGLTLRKSKE